MFAYFNRSEMLQPTPHCETLSYKHDFPFLQKARSNSYYPSLIQICTMYNVHTIVHCTLYSVQHCRGPDTRAQICKRFKSPGIDSKKSIPAGWESISGPLKGLQSRVLLLAQAADLTLSSHHSPFPMVKGCHENLSPTDVTSIVCSRTLYDMSLGRRVSRTIHPLDDTYHG